VALHRCSLNAIEPRSLGVFTAIELMTMKRGIRLMRGEGEEKLGRPFDLWRAPLDVSVHDGIRRAGPVGWSIDRRRSGQSMLEVEKGEVSTQRGNQRKVA
jgi:hypothetical protein